MSEISETIETPNTTEQISETISDNQVVEKRKAPEEPLIQEEKITKKSKRVQYEPKNPHSLASLIAKKSDLRAIQFLIAHLSINDRKIWEIFDDLSVKSTLFCTNRFFFRVIFPNSILF